MGYRLIAIDLDETLLNSELKISLRNKQAIRKAVQQGVKVTIATGRMFKTSIPYVRDLELNQDWPMINYHGALIKTTETRRVIYHQPIENRLAVAIAREAEKRGYHVNVYIDDRLYIREENEYSRYYQTIAAVDLEAVGALAPFLEKWGANPTKLTILNRGGALSEAEAVFKAGFGDHIAAMQTRPHFLEITDRRATKGQALHRLAEQEGIKREEILAFGDSCNDLDMIRYAGLGVAVANAMPEVLRAADLVAESNVNDGVARVIEEVVLI
ncbi:MAG: Cof-type HAD-IIB family hydrolase [Bacillota bacterium]